jgi:hypothetical protein
MGTARAPIRSIVRQTAQQGMAVRPVRLARKIGGPTGIVARMKSSVKLALALVAYAAVGTAIGIAARLPFQFGGIGDPARVSEDFLTNGTAVSPPIVALVILIVAVVVALQRGLVGRLGSGVLALLAVVFFVATLGEVFGSGAFSGATQLFVILWNLLGAALIAAMFVFGGREALRRT